MSLFRLSLLSASILLSQNGLADNVESKEVQALLERTAKLEQEIKQLKKVHRVQPLRSKGHKQAKSTRKSKPRYIKMPLSVHADINNPKAVTYNPTAIMAGDNVLTYIAGMPVISAPYLGRRPSFDGSDFIINISSINQDVRLMQQRASILEMLKTQDYPGPSASIIALSGAIEPMVNYSKPYHGDGVWDLDLGTAELDIAASLNAKVQGYLSFAYDSSAPNAGTRVSNSTFRLSKGFVNIGNLAKSPYYFTSGQFYVPFGRYSSSMISSPLPARLGRTIARSALLGFHHLKDEGVFGAIYGFKSETTNGTALAHGANLAYQTMHNGKRAEFGISYLSSINDASGMQTVSASAGQFAGFSASNAARAVNKVPAIDLHANFNMSAFAMSAEWVSGIKKFRTTDLSFNQQGARPQAFNVEAAYTFTFHKHPVSSAIGYGWSNQALVLGLPKQRVAAVFSSSIWRNTVQSLEFRHDIDYRASDLGAGAGSTANTTGTGKSSNTVTAQMGVYF